MATPWSPPQGPVTNRAWKGIAALVAVPLFALLLLRMFWSESALWFLAAGIILLGASAVFFLARRPQELEYDRRLLSEPNRPPFALAGLGVLFLALLLVPNFADSGSGNDSDSSGGGLLANQQPQSQEPADSQVADSQVADTQAQPASQAPAEEPSASTGPQTYTVQDGDTLWSIATDHGTTVEAIAQASDVTNPGDLQVGQQLTIPAASP